MVKAIRYIRGNRHMPTEIDVSPYRLDRGRPLRYKLARAFNKVQLTAFRKSGSGRRPYDSALMKF